MTWHVCRKVRTSSGRAWIQRTESPSCDTNSSPTYNDNIPRRPSGRGSEVPCFSSSGLSTSFRHHHSRCTFETNTSFQIFATSSNDSCDCVTRSCQRRSACASAPRRARVGVGVSGSARFYTLYIRPAGGHFSSDSRNSSQLGRVRV